MKSFTVTLIDGTTIEGGHGAGDGGAYSMFQEPHGVVVYWYSEARTDTFPWHQVKRVSWTASR